MTGPRDWDKELADVDKAIARLPAQPAAPSGERTTGSGAAQSGAAAPGVRAAHRPITPREATTTWLRVLLAVVLAAALPLWPYGHGCGISLYLYLGAVAMVVVAGVWAAVSTWRRRRPWAHTIALLVALWGVGLVAHEVLPRTGYAKHPARWTCG